MPGMLRKSAAFVPQYQKCRAWRHSDLARILIDAPRPRSSAGALQRHWLRPHRRAAFRSSQATERPWGDKPACADDRKFEEKENFATLCRLLRSRCLAQDACLQRNAKTSSRQTSDEALEPKPINQKSNPSSPCSGSKRTPMRPAALPGSRISETRETTDGSAELKFRIQFPPAESQQTFGSS